MNMYMSLLLLHFIVDIGMKTTGLFLKIEFNYHALVLQNVTDNFNI